MEFTPLYKRKENIEKVLLIFLKSKNNTYTEIIQQTGLTKHTVCKIINNYSNDRFKPKTKK